MKRFVFLPHTADIKFRAFGKNLNEVFENSALAFTSVLHDGKIKKDVNKKFLIKGNDLEALMFRFLEEILFLFETEGFLISNIKVKLSDDKKNLKVEAFGEEKLAGRARHYIKAVTYNDMFIKKSAGRWTAQVVIDV